MLLMKSSLAVLLGLIIALGQGQKNPNFAPGRNTIVHLFEWKWSDIAQECENFLAPKGYGGVQISPPNENLIVEGRPWYERYQPVGYDLNTRSGNEKDFAEMVQRCNKVGVHIYVDTVINHMAAADGIGTNGSESDYSNRDFPEIPYNRDDFNADCDINNYQDPENVRNCALVGLPDLNQGNQYVRDKIVAYMDSLVDLGVAGFRIDAAKHMWPGDLEAIYTSVKDLSTNHGFAPNTRPFIFQEVIDMGGEGVHKQEYSGIAAVLEFGYSKSISLLFGGADKLKYLANWGEEWGLLNGLDAVAFVDNHDNQRTDPDILTYRRSKQYKMAIAFMLAHPYGTTRVMSSFFFDNNDQGPPADQYGNLISPGFEDDNTCTNGYVCEHRWREVYNMIGFKNAVEGAALEYFWSNDDNQIAFCRYGKGFAAFTNGGDINTNIYTCLPEGTYCDVISGDLSVGKCTGKSVQVGPEGIALVQLNANEQDGVLAIHVNAKLEALVQ